MSDWPRKIDGHPKGHMAIFGDLRIAATPLCVIGNVLRCFKKIIIISIPEESWLGHNFKRHKSLTGNITDPGLRSINFWAMGAGNKRRRAVEELGKVMSHNLLF